MDHTHRFKEFEPIYAKLKEEPLQKEWLENKKMKFKDSLDDYDRLIKEVKEMDLPIDVYFGLEVCYVPEYEDYIRNVLKKHHYDIKKADDLSTAKNTVNSSQSLFTLFFHKYQ